MNAVANCLMRSLLKLRSKEIQPQESSGMPGRLNWDCEREVHQSQGESAVRQSVDDIQFTGSKERGRTPRLFHVPALTRGLGSRELGAYWMRGGGSIRPRACAGCDWISTCHASNIGETYEATWRVALISLKRSGGALPAT
jgi:hypothetical protein